MRGSAVLGGDPWRGDGADSARAAFSRPPAPPRRPLGQKVFSTLRDNVDPFFVILLLREDLKGGFYDISRQRLYGNELQ